jgi:ribosome-associated toxin RatA of RatAB toxin-antitoxin module
VARALLPENSVAAARPRLGVPGLQVIERSAIVTFTPAQMYALVNDVARYPEFLPWCVAAKFEDVAPNERLASLSVSRGVLRTEFTTRNTLQCDAEIMMRLVEGPFRSLTGRWKFDPLGGQGARVGFRVEFEFRNALTAAAFSTVFQSLCGTLVDAFVARARQIYG